MILEKITHMRYIQFNVSSALQTVKHMVAILHKNARSTLLTKRTKQCWQAEHHV